MRFAAPVAAMALLLRACAGDTDHNDADVTFAQQMVPHHEEAIEMARLAERAKDVGPDVRDLAEAIAGAQRPEIITMRGWLAEWDEHDTHGEHAAGGHGGGMTTDGRMYQLRTSSGATFDRLWLESMIEHHEGAVTMAEREMRDGEYSDAIDLAHDITRIQAREIDEMKELLHD
jgi:uncharacterized protein (DUF305 family)